MTKWHKHYGVYGLALNEHNQLLVVHKTRGPYNNRYDLPGGTLNKDESFKDCLRREFIEETGYSIHLKECCGVYDFLLNTPYNGCEFTQHLAIFYLAEIQELTAEVKSLVTDSHNISELNDSAFAKWIDIKQITYSNSSPLLHRAKVILTTQQTEYEIERYFNWEIIERHDD
jgi:ADP-ribose pyrophosphatase YjhB (NUDIX family)